MKKLISLITSFILFVAFLWATTGVTVYSHYCSESEDIYKSIFVEDANCEHHEVDNEIESCCAEKSTCNSGIADSDCCATQKQVFKLALSFNIPGEFQKLKIMDARLFIRTIIWIEEADEFDTNDLQNTDELPPGSYGKELLLAIQQQKIDPAPII